MGRYLYTGSFDGMLHCQAVDRKEHEKYSLDGISPDDLRLISDFSYNNDELLNDLLVVGGTVDGVARELGDTRIVVEGDNCYEITNADNIKSCPFVPKLMMPRFSKFESISISNAYEKHISFSGNRTLLSIVKNLTIRNCGTVTLGEGKTVRVYTDAVSIENTEHFMADECIVLHLREMEDRSTYKWDFSSDCNVYCVGVVSPEVGIDYMYYLNDVWNVQEFRVVNSTVINMNDFDLHTVSKPMYLFYSCPSVLLKKFKLKGIYTDSLYKARKILTVEYDAGKDKEFYKRFDDTNSYLCEYLGRDYIVNVCSSEEAEIWAFC